MKKLFIVILLSLLYVGSSDAAVKKIFGIAVDDTQTALTACTTFGFSIDATNTLPVGQNNARMVRVDRSGTTTYGYVLTSQATGYSVYVFDYITMAVVGSTVNTITGYRDAGRIQGDVGTDGKLYVFNEVGIANPSCSTANCVMMSRWNGPTLESAVIDNTSVQVDNIDDARQSGSNFLVVVSRATAPLVRQFRTYSMSALTVVTVGTQTATGNFVHIGRTITEVMYAAQADNAATPNIWTFASDSSTASGTATITYGIGRTIGAVFPLDVTANFFVFDSDMPGGASPQRAYVQPPTTAFGLQDFPNGITDLGAAFQGGFWDSLNVKVFSLRTSVAGVGVAQRSLVAIVPPFTVEENFACGAQCVNSGGMSTGTQVVDYSQTYARMYVGSNETPARLTRIKVCAVGGP